MPLSTSSERSPLVSKTNGAETSSFLGTSATPPSLLDGQGRPVTLGIPENNSNVPEVTSNKNGAFYYLVYAGVNVIISVPCLYGYAAVIFRHDAYSESMNALSKLVVFSSLMHQLGFLLFHSFRDRYCSRCRVSIRRSRMSCKDVLDSEVLHGYLNTHTSRSLSH